MTNDGCDDGVHACLQSILLIDFGYTWNVQPLISPSSHGPPS